MFWMAFLVMVPAQHFGNHQTEFAVTENRHFILPFVVNETLHFIGPFVVNETLFRGSAGGGKGLCKDREFDFIGNAIGDLMEVVRYSAIVPFRFKMPKNTSFGTIVSLHLTSFDVESFVAHFTRSTADINVTSHRPAFRPTSPSVHRSHQPKSTPAAPLPGKYPFSWDPIQMGR